MASASLIFWLMRVTLARSPTSKALPVSRLFCCRTRRHSSVLRPRISFSIALNAAMCFSASLGSERGRLLFRFDWPTVCPKFIGVVLQVLALL
ncbi:hypothetical protein ACVW16_001255 [Bradyrhizobium sp. USDA 4474]